MIDSRELRIGNWVDDHGNYRQITRLNMSQTIVDNPIPLSEEVLLKCPQLYQTPSGFFFRNEFISIELTTRGYCRISVANNPIKIYYLHEFQNVYPWFANRQELEVKWS